LSGVKQSNIEFGDVSVGKFFQIFNDDDLVAQFDDKTLNLFAYEVSTEQDETKDCVLAQILFAQSEDKELDSVDLQLFGIPLLRRLPKKFTTYECLYELIYKHIERSIQANKLSETKNESVSPSVSERIFEIMISDSGGMKPKSLAQNQPIELKDNPLLLLIWSRENKTKYYNSLADQEIPVHESVLKYKNKHKINKTDDSVVAALKYWATIKGPETDYCDYCKLLTKQYCYNQFYSLPNILVIALPKKPQLNNNNNINNEVLVRSLDLSQFLMQKSSPPPLYDLWAVLRYESAKQTVAAWCFNEETSSWCLLANNENSVLQVDSNLTTDENAVILFYQLRGK